MIDNFKSHWHYYWKTLFALISVICIINIFFSNFLNVISFLNLFILIIPNFCLTLLFYRYEIQRIQKHLEKHMKQNYNEKLLYFYDNYHNDTNPDSTPIFALFMDKELLKDDAIYTMKVESEKFIFLIVSVSAITIMVFLISTVFILRDNFLINLN